jgi:hypothetical protein
VVHAPGDLGLAREVLAIARAPMALPGFAPAAAPDSTTIILAATPREWSAATGGAAPEWAGGIASPEDRLIVLPVYPHPGVRELQVTLRHELAHLQLAARVPGPIPRWFHEGYAEVAAGGERARLAYLLSASAVDHLRRRSGDAGFALLMDNWRRTGGWETGLRATYGMTTGQLEEEWIRSVRSRFGWVLALGNATVVWLIATLLALIAWYPRRRRNRRRMDAMRKEERMLPPPRPEWDQVDYPIAEPPSTES